MKRLSAALLSAGIAILFAGAAFGQSISNSDHDFSSETWNTSGEICNVCHTPHNASGASEGPLWNHALTTQTFTVYTGADSTDATLDAVVGQPSGASKLCLSCHDGVTAIDSYGGQTGTTTITGNAAIGTDLSDDHPVSFTFDAALASADGQLHNPTTFTTPLGGTIQDDLLGGGDQLQCSSCHDAHDKTNGNFLRIANSGSALCLTCHDK